MVSPFRLLFAALLVLAVIFMVSHPVFAQSGSQGGGSTQPTYPTYTWGGYGVGWGGLALINAGLAQGKNRKGLNWFLISLLLGPIATLMLVAFYKKLPGAVTP